MQSCRNMKIIHYLFISCIFFISSSSLAQSSRLLDSASLDTTFIYTNLEDALKTPEQVIRLSLKRQRLDSIPVTVFLFTNLQYLDLSKNRLNFIPEEIGTLSNLQYLNISKNQLIALPANIGSLKHLKQLNLSQNKLTLLPETIGKLTALQYLNLWYNDIGNLPSSLPNLKHLTRLELRATLLKEKDIAELKKKMKQTNITVAKGCDCQN